jgi:MYXO-CTERM domain-containing protein
MWSCVQPPTAVSGCAVSPTADGSTACTPIEMPPVQSVCEPPYFDLSGGGSFGSGLSEGAAPTAGSVDDTGSGGGTSKSASTPVASSDQGGCSMGTGPANAQGGAWLALLGFGAFLRRRWLRA